MLSLPIRQPLTYCLVGIGTFDDAAGGCGASGNVEERPLAGVTWRLLDPIASLSIT